MMDYCYDNEFNTMIGLLETIAQKLEDIHQTSIYSFKAMSEVRNKDIDNHIERLEQDLKVLRNTSKEYRKIKIGDE